LKESEGVEHKKVSPKKKVMKKKSPVKKVVKKKSPVKKPSPVKKVTKKAPKRCDAKEDPLECDEGDLCSATSGKCMKDTPAVRKGKSELHVDGRIIVGTAETIDSLQKILGGEVKRAGAKAEKVKKVSSVKKTPTPKKRSSSPKRKSSTPKRTPSPVRKASSVKKAPSAPKRASPKDVKGLERRLEELLAEDMQDEIEISKIQAKLKALKGKKAPSPVAGKRAGKVEMKKQEIYDTFKKCLESLKA